MCALWEQEKDKELLSYSEAFVDSITNKVHDLRCKSVTTNQKVRVFGGSDIERMCGGLARTPGLEVGLVDLRGRFGPSAFAPMLSRDTWN